MFSLQNLFGTFGQILQGHLFPVIEEELGPLSERCQEFVRALALLQMDGFVTVQHGPGRPAHDRACIARAFLAKAIFSLPHTRALLERLSHDATMRRLCGWEKASQVPDETIFSRAFAEFARSEFPQQVHAALISRTQSQRLVGHVLRDGTAIEACEKPVPKAPKVKVPGARRLHRKSGTAKRPEQMTRIDRQCSGRMTLEEMLADLPRGCNVGCKPNSRGIKESWTGYKLHMDVADGQIPISCVLTSASLNDNQVAIPLAIMTAQRVTSCYDLMDAGYDCEAIREHSRTLGHVPIIERQKHGGVKLEMAPHEKVRYRERTTVERVYSRLKERFGGSTIRVRGAAKVMAHLMFGIVALTADQILRWSSASTESGTPAPS
jgi:hypothetical protein